MSASSLRGGIIAAGLGTRLKAGGYAMSKAMTPVLGRPLIAHTLERFREAGIRNVSLIINEASADCREWLAANPGGLDLDVVVRTTPSSYASFAIIADRLAGAPALITTVDSILPVEDFRAFVRTAAALPDDAVVLGVTPHVDDEKPLWATLDGSGRIHSLGAESGTHVTAGLYWLPARRPAAPHAVFERLRDYLKWLAERTPTYGVSLPLVYDIDRPADIEAAEATALRREHESIP
jgi:NDP-sugar pyrophosphorylase family protein